ncbi:MAG: biotin-dependent carboxyltransferase family protein [Pseudomonadota bacterium]
MFEVLRCGPVTTIQDPGRHGMRHLGISQCGALDPVANRQVNLLLGNTAAAAVLEILHPPLLLACHADCDVALAGDDMDAHLLDQHRHPLPGGRLAPGRVHIVRGGQLLHLPGRRHPGNHCVLGVAGGFDVPLVLGSRSTDLNNCFGGLEGRPLQSGDRLYVDRDADSGRRLQQGIRPIAPNGQLRAIPGPEFEQFTRQSRLDIWQTRWTVGRQSNRVGLRLGNTPLRSEDTGHMSSSAVLPGVVQVPHDGYPVLLGNDAQTTGGYPRIISVISADLWKLAYLTPGGRIRFEQVSVDRARAIRQQWQRYWARLEMIPSGEAS